ncbi:hypothetical protein PWT90_09238 [Aphanocladium album]|nr:hypothetical protein PWT90_09238 [Aphanocladium album]
MAVARVFAHMLWQNRNDGKFVDYKLRCQGHTIDVHKIILASHSPVFLTALSGPFTEKDAGLYDIKDSSPTLVFKMVEFMYTGTYTAPTGDWAMAEEACSAPVFHANMISLADKYLIAPLYDEAKKQFAVSVNFNGDLLTCIRSAPEIYKLDPDGRLGLSKDLLNYIAQRLKEVTPDSTLYAALDDVCHDWPSFATDILKLVITRDHWQLRFT